MALGRLGPSAVRVIRSAPVRLHVRSESGDRQPPETPAVDVELEVREHLYGVRSGSR
ncbi:MAG TPA: hypothetical protein VGH24_11640 [Solirubrobacteraceae bacterium]